MCEAYRYRRRDPYCVMLKQQDIYAWYTTDPSLPAHPPSNYYQSFLRVSRTGMENTIKMEGCKKTGRGYQTIWTLLGSASMSLIDSSLLCFEPQSYWTDTVPYYIGSYRHVAGVRMTSRNTTLDVLINAFHFNVSYMAPELIRGARDIS